MKAKETMMLALAALLGLGILGCKSKPEPEPVDVAARLAEARAQNAADLAAAKQGGSSYGSHSTSRRDYIK